MSTIRATYVQHGSSSVPNITLNASGQVIVASGIVSSGTFAAPSGSAAAPGVYFVGDTDTGLYSPGANQIAIATSGVAALTVDASQRVGVGTTSPNVALTISAGAVSTGAVVPTSDIAFPSAYGNGFFRAVGNYNQGAGTGGTIQLGGKSYTDAPNVGAFLISAVSASNATDALTFSTQTSYSNVVSERARIDSSGRLLIGTSSTATTGNAQYALLQVRGNSFSTANNAILNIGRGEAATSITSGEDIGNISFTDSAGNEFAEIKCTADATAGSGDYPGRLVFSTTADGASSPTEHYRISSSGYLSITSNVGLYNLRQTTYNTSSNAVMGIFGSSNNDGVNNGSVYNIEWKMNGNASGQFWYANYITNGGSRTLGAYCTGTAWTNSSDIANKEQITDTRYGLDTVLALRPVDFRWKSQRDANGDGKPDIGFIAQEMEQIVPEVVTGAEGSKGISYGNLVSVLTKAIQEQQTMIAELQDKVAALESA